MTAAHAIDRRLASPDLVAELAIRARRDGASVGLWPGLTIYRFSEPTQQRWERDDSATIGVAAQGRAVASSFGRRYICDQFSYAVMGRHAPLDWQILEASTRRPFLGMTLQIDPQLVRKVAADAFGSTPPGRAHDGGGTECAVAILDEELRGTVVRYLRSLSTQSDRRVLAPLCLQELVYRVLAHEQPARILGEAAERTVNPLGEALDYIAAHLADQLTVTAVAQHVHLSPSAFSRVFRETTGRSPYQFVKDSRLTRARELLIDGRLGVAEVSRSVGYTSVSHFIKEFRGRFGSTPGDYAETQPFGTWLHAVRATAV